jgi:hypothetical protein
MTGDDLLPGLASYGLSGARPLAAELDAGAGRELLDAAKPEKLVGLLDQAVADGVVSVPEEVAVEIGEAAVAVAAWCLLVERHTLVVHDLLDVAGIEHRFLKGPTIAHRYEPHAGLRSFVDVDVLVRGDDIAAVVSTLEAHGHHRNQPEFRPGYDATWAKSVTMRASNGIEVDVHRVFASGPFGLRASPAPLWARGPATVVLGGSALPCLDPEATCVQACVHATTGTRTRLSTWRDVARLVLAADAAAVDRLASALGVGACVTRAAQRSWSVLSLVADEEVAQLLLRPISPREQGWLDLYVEKGDDFRALTLAGIRAVPGLRNRAALVRVLVGRPTGRHHP